MYPQQQLVREMMTAFEQGDQIRNFPNMIQDPKERLLAANLVIEEAFEFVEALGFTVSVDKNNSPVLAEGPAPDLEEAAKELGDIQVVIDGAANRLGIDMQTAFVEVHRANMSKTVNGKVIKRESDGKVMKPHTYKPANMATIISNQREAEINKTVTQVYKPEAIAIAKGASVYAVLGAAIYNNPSVTPAVITQVFAANQKDTVPYKLRVLVRTLLFLGANGRVDVNQLVETTGLTLDVVSAFVEQANIKYPYLFSGHIILPKTPVESSAPAKTDSVNTDPKVSGKKQTPTPVVVDSKPVPTPDPVPVTSVEPEPVIIPDVPVVESPTPVEVPAETFIPVQVPATSEPVSTEAVSEETTPAAPAETKVAVTTEAVAEPASTPVPKTPEEPTSTETK